MKKALILSGGGARCVAQLGYVSYLKEMGIEFDLFSGSSGGALVAAFLAKGYDPFETYQIIKKINFKKLIKFNFKRNSLFHLKKAVLFLEDEYGLKSFDDLEKKLFVCVTDYESYETLYINSGQLAHCLMASCSLIPLFEPYMIEDRLFIDGGFSDNLPVTPCLKSDFTLCINVNPPLRLKNSFFANFYRAAFILLNSNIKYSKDKSDKFVEIQECGEFSIFDTKNFDRIYKAGLQKAKKDREYWLGCF